jgi:hypothetical protein
MPLAPLLANQLSVLEGEHRSFLAVSAPAYHDNVARALTFIGLAVVPSPRIGAAIARVRRRAQDLVVLLQRPETVTAEIEAARHAAVRGVLDLREALDSAQPSPGAIIAGRQR